ncbi:hypothetical protein AYJ57_13205 [Salipiger sp. CCB-MM3]|uniref:lysylphosphatidylglycerol synthase transmembrane domain-containing protein n=1 Tax=Salipiger sp. CCB-MM3 TaxID=1792508 RepID=UPI00080A9935|nr:lysylphosphatidylglycerol synthase transmembrane domain-containing protein [Salipiger sp. CCB-MM3]ANT61243.1 hypothetical protein AYJ57_13205 [Salipiger sp. CCB-MM3]
MQEDAVISPPTERSKRGFPLGWWLRVAGSLALLGATLAILPLEQLGDAFARLDVTTLCTVLAAFLALHGAASLKWWMLCERRVPMLVAVRAHLAGLAGNLCLPGVIGGDLVRAGIVARAHGDTAHLVSASVLDRLIDMLALLFVAAAGLLGIVAFRDSSVAGFDAASLSGFFAIALAVVALLVAVVLVFPHTLDRVSELPMPKRLRSPIAKVVRASRAVAASPQRIGAAFAFAILIQSGLAILAYALAGRAGVEIGLAAWVFAWTLAKILAVLPVSLGGLGVREAALSLLLAPFTSDLGAVVAASLVWQVVLFLGGLVGGGIWLVSEVTGGRRMRGGDLTLPSGGSGNE